MTLLQKYYKLRKKDPPSYARNTLLMLLFKPFRKYFNVVIIPNIPINLIRIWCYRLIGFNIGKNVFIGMKCYMDDVSPNNTIIEDNVVISYGCYFSIHGKRQGHTQIKIKKDAYLGMKVSVLGGKKGVVIGERAFVGACSLVISNIANDSTVVGIPAKPIKK